MLLNTEQREGLVTMYRDVARILLRTGIHKRLIEQYVEFNSYVEVLGRNQTLFHCIFRSITAFEAL